MIALELARTIRFGLLAVGLLAPMAVGVLLRAAGESPVVIATLAREPAPTPCDSTRFDDTCPEGHLCAAGRCMAAPVSARAGAGEACRGLTCVPGTECHQESCVPVEKLPVAPATCREPEVGEVLERLQRHCQQARGRPIAVLADCQAEQWRAISESDRSFESKVISLPGTFAVFFPDAVPGRDWKWPSSAVNSRSAEALEQHVPALQRARHILIIGRASNTGDPEENRGLAERRAEMVERLVVKRLGAGHPPLSRWGLAADFDRSPHLVRTMIEVSIVTDPENIPELARLQAAPFDVDRMDEARHRALDLEVDRAAFVVPLPCDGSEYNPLPAFRGRSDDLRRLP